jgi:hypothetical protein
MDGNPSQTNKTPTIHVTQKRMILANVIQREIST